MGLNCFFDCRQARREKKLRREPHRPPGKLLPLAVIATKANITASGGAATAFQM